MEDIDYQLLGEKLEQERSNQLNQNKGQFGTYISNLQQNQRQNIEAIISSHKERIYNSDLIYKLDEDNLDRNPQKSLEKTTKNQTIKQKRSKSQNNKKRSVAWRTQNRDKADHEYEFQDYIKSKRDRLTADSPVQQVDYKPKILKNRTLGNSEIGSEMADLPDFAFKNSAEILENFQRIFEQNDDRQYKGSQRVKDMKDDEIYLLSYLYNQMRKRSHQKDSITKEEFENYLIDNPQIMNLYNINPLDLQKMLGNLVTKKQNLISRPEMLAILMDPLRRRLKQFNLQAVEDMVNKRPKRLNMSTLKEAEQNTLIQQFVLLDTFGEHIIPVRQLIHKIRNTPATQELLPKPAIYVNSIDKYIPLERLIYELEQETYHAQPEDFRKLKQNIKWDEYIEFLDHYERRNIPTKDKVIQALKLTAQFDHGDTIILPKELLQVLKDVFTNCELKENYFVSNKEFCELLQEHDDYYRFRRCKVRDTQYSDQIPQENVDQTIQRILLEGDQYLYIDEIIDFFTRKGRPFTVQKQYDDNKTQKQFQKSLKEYKRENISSSPEEKKLKDKRKNRKLEKIKALKEIPITDDQFKNQKKINGALRKGVNDVFQITKPIPFNFEQREAQKDHTSSILSRRLQADLDRKKRKEDEECANFGSYRASEVPEHVKDRNKWKTITFNQERKREQRKLESMKLTKENEAPFSFYLRDKDKKQEESHWWEQPAQPRFKADEIPWYCSVLLLERMQREKFAKSQIGIAKRKRELMDMNGVPEETINFLNRLNKNEQNKEEKQRGMFEKYLQVFQRYRARSVPNFKQLHKDYDEELAERKKAQKKTVPQEFKFSQTKKDVRRSYMDEENKFQRDANELPRRPLSVVFKPPKHLPQATLKWEAQLLKRQEEEEIKNFEQDEKKQREEDKAFRRIQFAKFVRGSAAIVDNSKQTEERKQNLLKQKRSDMQQQDFQFDQMMTNMMKRVIRRPLLVEQCKFFLLYNKIVSSGNYGHDRVKRLKQLLGDIEISEEEYQQEELDQLNNQYNYNPNEKKINQLQRNQQFNQQPIPEDKQQEQEYEDEEQNKKKQQNNFDNEDEENNEDGEINFNDLNEEEKAKAIELMRQQGYKIPEELEGQFDPNDPKYQGDEQEYEDQYEQNEENVRHSF